MIHAQEQDSSHPTLISISVDGEPITSESEPFFSTLLSIGWFFGPDFVDTEGSFGIDMIFGRRFFVGGDFTNAKMTFTNTKLVSGASGDLYILDGVVGVSADLIISRWFLGVGAGSYLCNCKNIPNDPDFTGFAMNFFLGAYLKGLRYFNLGLIYKHYALAEAGWYNTFGFLASISIENFGLAN